MSTKTLVRRHANGQDYCNDPSTVYGYVDVLAVAEIIYGMMCAPAVGLRIQKVSIQEICEAVERVQNDVQAQTDAFVDGLANQSVLQAERDAIVAFACSDLVAKGWLKRAVEKNIFPRTFWDDPEVDQHEIVKPSNDLILLIHRHFECDTGAA